MTAIPGYESHLDQPGFPIQSGRERHTLYSNVDEDAAVVRFAQVSPRLTTLVPQAHHKTANAGRLPWSEDFDRMLRNEGSRVQIPSAPQLHVLIGECSLLVPAQDGALGSRVPQAPTGFTPRLVVFLETRASRCGGSTVSPLSNIVGANIPPGAGCESRHWRVSAFLVGVTTQRACGSSPEHRPESRS